MSHFVQIRTQIREAGLLVDCLRELGFAEVERHELAQPLYGYQGDERPQRAEVIVRRKFVGRASNDIGFRRSEGGEYEAVISEYDRGNVYGDGWMADLNWRYAYKVIREQAREQYLTVEEERETEDGNLVMVLSERG